MDSQQRKALTDALSKLSAEIAAEMRAAMLVEGPAREAARRLHAEERVGDALDVWTDLLARRGAVLWVLKSVYVRVLEDRRLLAPGRILDPESQSLFEHLAPNLGPTAYLRWVYRDLGAPRGGLPELFAPQPAEIVVPSDALSQKLLDFWRRRDPDTGALVFRFDEEHFDGRLMGDLYQDLDPVVKKRYALLQTPDFIIDFILDETLTPAIGEWGVETVRVLDPACGSGHFLLAAFKRLVAGMRVKFPDKTAREIVTDVLRRVVGIDLNDYACALARARLIMTALESCGETDLQEAAAFHPLVYWADALEQVERDDVEQLGLFGAENGRPKALLTRPEVRTALRPVLKAGFQVVVGNPPYIQEKDANKREYHKEKLGKAPRYASAFRTYSLGAPFTERMLQLAAPSGYIGEITADSFMKREFGKALVEQVLARTNLTKVISAANVYIPGHGTATVMLFVQNRVPNPRESVRVVMGKRGEGARPQDPAQGKVWLSIVEGHGTPSYESEYVSVADLPRTTLALHPWSIGGGGARELKERMEQRSPTRLGTVAEWPIGRGTRTGDDEAFARPTHVVRRPQRPVDHWRLVLTGEEIRDWAAMPSIWFWYPYVPDNDLEVVKRDDPSWQEDFRLLWLYRTSMANRATFHGKMADASLEWYEYMQYTPSANRGSLAIVFAFKATHNHAGLDRGGRIFKQTAPVIKLPSNATEGQYLVVLAQLNSSGGEFWVKQSVQSMGAQGIGRGIATEEWEHFYERDGTKLESFPLIATSHPDLESFARALDTLARERVADSPRAILAASAASDLRSSFLRRRERDLTLLAKMVGLQEELDWLCYKLYGIDPDPDAEVRDPDHTPLFYPGLRPFEITLAQEDAERRAAVARGEEPDEQPTAWFTRHGWEPHTTLDALPPDEQRIVAARIERTAASRDLGLVEQPTYKRRWYKPDYESEEREAMELWLADRIEAWAKDRKAPFTIRQAVAALQLDPAVLAVAELLAGRRDFDLEQVLSERFRADSVPNNKHHVFKPDGLIKRAAWEETWAEQHKEDAGLPATPQVPPKYASSDYQKPEYWSLRGKLDVPKERFIAFTEAPATGDGTLYGWAGWTPRERARALLELDERLENESVPVDRRIGLLHGVWFLLPYVAWESRPAADEFRAIVKSFTGDAGVTEAMLEAWAKEDPPGGGKKKAPGKKAGR